MGIQKEKPTKEQLIADILEADNRDDIAAKYNVSLSTVKRWFTYYKVSFSDIKYKEKEKKVLELYESCNNNSDIAKSSNISKSSVKRILDKNDLKSKFQYKTEKLESDCRNLYNAGKNIEEISSELNLDLDLVKYILLEKPLLPSRKNVTKNQFQIVLGSLLGDGNISPNRSGNQFRFVYAHSLKQEKYAFWKGKELANLGHYEHLFKISDHFDNRTQHIYYSRWYYSYELPIFRNLYHRFYINKIKHIPDIVYKLNPLGLAIWYMDDGYRQHNCAYLCTECFSKEDLEKLQDMMNKNFGIIPKITNNNELHISKEYSKQFFSIIKPYITEDLKYKLPDWINA